MAAAVDISRAITVINSDKPRKKRGRPPAFDRQSVLARAAETFWRLGYEGASIVDLTGAMGITPQSLYGAFGSKAQLYDEALGWYRSEFGALTPEALEGPDVLGTLGRLLVSEAKKFTDPDHPPGCMISTAVLGCSEENNPIADNVANLRRDAIGLIRKRLDRALSEGELAADADPAAIARYIGTIIQGMSVQARDGATEQELVAVAELAASDLGRWRGSVLPA